MGETTIVRLKTPGSAYSSRSILASNSSTASPPFVETEGACYPNLKELFQNRHFVESRRQHEQTVFSMMKALGMLDRREHQAFLSRPVLARKFVRLSIDGALVFDVEQP
jgi:hypothetical protein